MKGCFGFGPAQCGGLENATARPAVLQAHSWGHQEKRAAKYLHNMEIQLPEGKHN